MPETDLDLLQTAAREAGEIARRYWRAEPQVWDKGGGDPVSEADLAVDKHLRTRLLASRPDYGWVSEETEDDPSRHATERVFIVDPIDGTRSFLKGEPTWAHALAVIERGRVIAGCVYLPERDKLYLAAEGRGATLNGVPISAARTSGDGTPRILAPRVALEPEFWRSGAPGFERHFRPSLAYRMALVAEGRFDGMLTLRAAWEWDIAAGALIASESGAKVTDRAGQPLAFNSPGLQSDGVIAAGAALHGALLSDLL